MAYNTGMRVCLLWVFGCTLALTGHSELVFEILTPPGADSATVMAGDTLSLRTHVTSEAAEPLGGVVYDLTLVEGAVLVSREYGRHGWLANDGVFDLSACPDGGTVPALAGLDPWPFTAQPNIHFDTVRQGFVELPGGDTYVLEDFGMHIPRDTPAGTHTLSFDYLEAAAITGTPNYRVTGRPFVLIIQAIPEPGSFITLGSLWVCVMLGLNRNNDRPTPRGHEVSAAS